MTIQFNNDYAHFIATSRNILREHGISVTTGSDFDVYKRIVSEERPTQAIGVPFDPDRVDLKQKRSFWLIGPGYSVNATGFLHNVHRY